MPLAKILNILIVRQGGYSCLSRFYHAEPEPALLKQIAADNPFDGLTVEQEFRDQWFELLNEFLARVPYLKENNWVSIWEEYRTLFFGPGHLLVPPWESVYRGN